MLPVQHTLAGASKRKRTSWVWHVGYASFRRGKTWTFAGNTLNNVEKHLKEVHMLDEGGDTWRKQRIDTFAQASGPVDGSYDRIILFQELAFKAYLLKFAILKKIKFRKLTSGHFAALIKLRTLRPLRRFLLYIQLLVLGSTTCTGILSPLL
jgi:hypothetical protein